MMATLLKTRARAPLADGRVDVGWRHSFGDSGRWQIEIAGDGHRYTLSMDEREARLTVKVLQHLLQAQGRSET